MADLTITAANVVKGTGAVVDNGTAGETLTAGQALYLKSTDSRLWKAQCDGTAEEGTFIGIALHAASVAQPIEYQTDGELNIGATTAKTTHYMLSAALGGICPQADLVSTNKIVFIGYAKSTAGLFKIFKENTGVTV